MPSGDAKRVWFPELLEALTAAWSPAMSWDELARLLAQLTERRRAIREERGILPPLTTCRSCGATSRADIEGISILSALFALKNTGAVGDADFARLRSSWRKHQAARRLDACGRPRLR